MLRKTRLLILVCIITVSGLVTGAFYYFSNGNTVVENNKTETASSTFPIEFAPSVATEGGTPPRVVAERKLSVGESEYQNKKYGFSLFYPKNLAVEEFDDGGGASTIVFQNPSEGLGFQIYIAPFSGNQITEERFRQDVPSSVRNELREIVVDGAVGASFYSADAFLGETAEVWFIKNGFLYEVMAPKVLAPWLNEIMETWRFI